MSTHKHLTKHRPYLTEQTILWLYNKASELRLEDEGANIAFMEIAPYTLKLNLKTVGGSYTSSPKETLLDSLGKQTDTFIDPNVSKLMIYNKYMSTPDECTEDEFIIAVEYKYYVLKETLTPEEQKILDNSW